MYEANAEAFCSPVCHPDSCPVGQPCSIMHPSLCLNGPCPGILTCGAGVFPRHYIPHRYLYLLSCEILCINPYSGLLQCEVYES